MYFIDIKEYGGRYNVLYYEVNRDFSLLDKNNSLKSMSISKSNPMSSDGWYKLLYKIKKDMVFLLNMNTRKQLEHIYVNENIDLSRNAFLIRDFINYCTSINPFDAHVVKTNNIVSFIDKKDGTASILDLVKACFYLFNIYGEKYINSLPRIIDKINDTSTEKAIYHFVDVSSIEKYDFLANIDLNEHDRIIFFHNNYNQKLNFYALKHIVENRKNVYIEDYGNHPLDLTIQTHILSLNKELNTVFIYSSNDKIFSSFKYIAKNTNWDIRVALISNSKASDVLVYINNQQMKDYKDEYENLMENKGFYDVSMSIIEDDDEDDI